MNNKIHRREFICGAIAGAAGLAMGKESLAELASAPFNNANPDKLGQSQLWNEAPALGFDSAGNLISAWTGYGKQKEDIFVARYENGKPLPAEKITGIDGPNFSPTIIANPNGGFQVFWVGNRGGRWRVISRTFNKGKWSVESVVSPDEDSSCIHTAAALVGTNTLLVWERLDCGSPEIWMTMLGTAPMPARKVAVGGRPTITADGNGGAWLAWQTAKTGLYEMHASRFDGNNWSKPEIVASGDSHFRHASIGAAPNGDIWLTCEGLMPNRSVYEWEKQYRLDDTCRMLPLSERTFRRTKSGWQKVAHDPMERVAIRPKIVPGDKQTWIVYYQHARFLEARKFKTVVTSLDKDGNWQGDIDLYNVVGAGGKNPIAALVLKDQLIVAVQADVRPMVNDPAWSVLPGESHIYVCRLNTIPQKPAISDQPSRTPSPFFRNPDHSPNPTYSVKLDEEELNLYFGDLHKHGEISMCGITEGEVSENYEYSRDIRMLDFMQSTDHAEHHDEHDWFTTRKYASVFNVDGQFTAFAGYEWTSEFSVGDNLRCGHYNPTFLSGDGNLACLSASIKASNTPDKLWAGLRASLDPGDDVITILHHTGRKNAPVDWNYYDPDINPLVEITQARGSFEYYGCPDTDRLINDIGRTRGKMVQDGFARGYKMGIVGSGDHHGSSIVGIYAPGLSRRDLFYALKNRRCYGTNGAKIVLDFSVDGHFMGQIFDSESSQHVIKMVAKGRSIKQVDIWKDGRIIYSENIAGLNEVSLTFTDDSKPDRQESYYYARVIQQDLGMAWSSPVWIKQTNVDPSVCFYVDDKAEETVAPSTLVYLPMVIRNERPDAVKVRVKVEAPDGWNVDWTTRDYAAKRPPNEPEESVARASGRTICESDFEVDANSWKEPLVELAAPAAVYDGFRGAKLTMTAGSNQTTFTVRLGVKEPQKKA